jgi:5-formyltetrahydrofolate cyclo-ligase
MTGQSLISTPEKIKDAKAQLRREAQARRDALPAETRKAAAETIAARPFPLPVAPGTIVSGFMPLKSEARALRFRWSPAAVSR